MSTATQTEKKYVLHPGPVLSLNDGQVHSIDAPTLARLYGVPMEECVIVEGSVADLVREVIGLPRRYPDWVHLYPKLDGDYTLPRTEGDTP